MNINWYPGHMVKAKNDIIATVKLIDIVVEILDARIPKSSQNPNIDDFASTKERIVVLNKEDLADKEKTIEWKKSFNSKNISVVLLNASSGRGIKELVDTIQKIGKKIYEEKYKDKKINIEPIYRVLIVGIPNVGKSTIINKISGKNSALVGNKPGVTKKNQWVRVYNNIDLLDSPGLLWPKFESEEVGINLALTGNINQDILDIEELAYFGIKKLLRDEKYKKLLYDRYEINEEEVNNELSKLDDSESIEIAIINLIGKKRGCLVAGGNIDINKVSKVFLDDFKNGKIGRITLE
ncbi:MAG: ribosome biogenesis GTPase YlqF [Clostridia bacterium]|nr:ribosome biogenesis GTPase YlqF [Clostridia bacterium]